MLNTTLDFAFHPGGCPCSFKYFFIVVRTMKNKGKTQGLSFIVLYIFLVGIGSKSTHSTFILHLFFALILNKITSKGVQLFNFMIFCLFSICRFLFFVTLNEWRRVALVSISLLFPSTFFYVYFLLYVQSGYNSFHLHSAY